MAKVLVNFQDEFLQEVDKVAELEHRTRSSLIREAVRRYLSGFHNDSKKDDTSQIKTLVSTNPT